jgi:DNA-binding CsgD family transcriptional regulator
VPAFRYEEGVDGFVGRAAELAVLGESWARRDGFRFVGVAGAPGIGKTALVRRFVDGAGGIVWWASGDEAEAGLPWGVLSQLTDAPADDRADPAFVARGLAKSLPDNVIVVVDDAQWADRASLSAIRLATRRASGPGLVILGYQPGGLDDGWRRVLDSDRGARLELAGLPPADLVRLAVACGHPGLTPAGAARLHEHTGGHPLHVRHLLDELPMRAIVFGQGALPAPRGIAAAVHARLAACQEATRDVVAAGAVLGRRFSVVALRQLGVGTAGVAEAIEAGLVAEVPGSLGHELSFTSTLIRGLVYHDLDRDRRRRLHLLAARHTGNGAVWHRLAAADGPDPVLAADLEREARGHLERGQLARAATLLRHAVDLTPPGSPRRRRLLIAVELLLVAGDQATAAGYRAELDAGSDAWSDYVAGYQLLVTGQVAPAKARLERALTGVRQGKPDWPGDLEARIATQLAIIGVLSVSYSDMIDYGSLAVATAGEPWVMAFAAFARSLGLAIAGRGAEALADLSTVDDPGSPSGLDGLVARGMIRLWTDDLAGARQDLTAAVRRATAGETLRIGQALGFLGEVEYRRGALDEAVVHAELAIGDAEENNRVWDYAMLHGIASYPLAAQGEWRRAEAHVAAAAHWAGLVGSPAGLVYAAAGRAAVAQARGDATRLLAAAEELESIYPGHEPGTHLCGPLRAQALSQLGRLPEAAAALADFTARLGGSERRSTLQAVARVRAQLALAAGRPGEALEECRRAGELARAVGLPLEAARVELLAGACQAESGRRAAAERTLRSALRQFTAVGATAYAAQTRRVAERAGLPLDEPPAVLATLTRAERAVASLVRQGLSNREIAERLVLSRKTVEFHLTNAFRRLDVSTRAELCRIIEDSAANPGW